MSECTCIEIITARQSIIILQTPRVPYFFEYALKLWIILPCQQGAGCENIDAVVYDSTMLDASGDIEIALNPNLQALKVLSRSLKLGRS